MYYAAAYKHVPMLEKYFASINNLFGTILVNSSHKYGVKEFLFVSMIKQSANKYNGSK